MPTVNYDLWIDREASIQLDEGKTAKDLQAILAAQGQNTYDGTVEVWCSDGIRIGRLELYKLKDGETVSFCVCSESDAANRLKRENDIIEAARAAETRRVHAAAAAAKQGKEESCKYCGCGKQKKPKTTYQFDGLTVETISNGFIIHY